MAKSNSKKASTLSLGLVGLGILCCLASFLLQFAPQVQMVSEIPLLGKVSIIFAGLGTIYGGKLSGTVVVDSGNMGEGDIPLFEAKFNSANFIGYMLILAAVVLLALSLIGFFAKIRRLLSFISCGCAVAGAIFTFMFAIFFQKINGDGQNYSDIFQLAWGSITAGSLACAGALFSLVGVFVPSFIK